MDEHNERSVIELLQEISSGLLDPKLLDASSRQRCIQALKDEGRTIPQISNLLHCSERTVRRDWKVLKEQNAITADSEFCKQTIGELSRQATIHISYLMRIARDKGTTTAEKIQAEFGAWRVFKEYIEKLQTTGYLPLKPTTIVGNFYNNDELEGCETVIEVKRMLVEIEDVAKDTGTHTPELIEQVKMLKAHIDEAEVISEVKKLKDKQQKEISNKEEKENEK